MREITARLSHWSGFWGPIRHLSATANQLSGQAGYTDGQLVEQESNQAAAVTGEILFNEGVVGGGGVAVQLALLGT
jgi:hypothetical protein